MVGAFVKSLHIDGEEAQRFHNFGAWSQKLFWYRLHLKLGMYSLLLRVLCSARLSFNASHRTAGTPVIINLAMFNNVL